MSSSGLIYAVIVGAWAAYLVPMWLRRQDELNEARPTERFSTAIRLLSGRAGMERRYAKDLRARSTDEGEPGFDDPDAVTDSVDVRAFAMPPTRPQAGTVVEAAKAVPASESRESGTAPARADVPAPAPPRKPIPPARRAPGAEAAAARARRTKVLARRRRTTIMLFLAFTLGAVVAAVGGLTFLWAPGVPAVLLSGYIVYLRAQERRRFAYQMDRRQAEAAAQRLRERTRQPRRHAVAETEADEPEEGHEPETDAGLSALAADRRALVEQTDHAEWVDQQRERQRRPGHGESWDPVPVPLPTYVTAPVAPRATSEVDLGALDAWSSARSGPAAQGQETPVGSPERAAGTTPAASAASAASPADAGERGRSGATDGAADGASDKADGEGRGDARRRAASARRARERGRTPLFDQYEEGERPRAANE
ncbi:gephyrin-like molybdotransferase receptor GlpR [Streptomyces sp. NPDC089424]|uniref:divisome protein SepX/GlpR n=1 Tax=Streptomyces sp. NPDC089424 TaxID=3365917 RepID=UPI0038206A19